MTTLRFGPLTLAISVTTALLAGCGGSRPLIGAPSVVPRTAALAVRTDSTNFKTVYSFGGGSDGADPNAGLIDVGDTLYGTTVEGGSHSCTGYGINGCGTIFSVTLAGTEKVLHAFGAGNDGRVPRAGLAEVGGTLYGTTLEGGSHACYGYNSTCGTVFSVTPSGTEKVVRSFDGTDGELPYAGLIDVRGTLYGTTWYGGAYLCSSGYFYCGTVFSVTQGGKEKVLHSFGGRSDGSNPDAGLIDIKGTLYGTTSYGGVLNSSNYGTVFSITPGGKEQVLHTFESGPDGAFPNAGLIDVKGTLYGTTTNGGRYSCGGNSCGTVFSITPNGTEKVLHSFGNGTDGVYPNAGLIEMQGELYGTTANGGTRGEGTVFSITPGGTEKVLHSFDGTGGAYPYAALLGVKGMLYGTTFQGGAHNYGTVFSLKP